MDKNKLSNATNLEIERKIGENKNELMRLEIKLRALAEEMKQIDTAITESPHI